MADSFDRRIDELASSVGDGVLTLTERVNQPYAMPIERGRWVMYMGKVPDKGMRTRTNYLHDALKDYESEYLDRYADAVLSGVPNSMVTAAIDIVEQLNSQMAANVNKRTFRLSQSGSRRVIDNGELVYFHPASRERMRNRADDAAVDELQAQAEAERKDEELAREEYERAQEAELRAEVAESEGSSESLRTEIKRRGGFRSKSGMVQRHKVGWSPGEFPPDLVGPKTKSITYDDPITGKKRRLRETIPEEWRGSVDPEDFADEHGFERVEEMLFYLHHSDPESRKHPRRRRRRS